MKRKFDEQYINELERYYFEKIYKAFECNGTSIVKTLSSGFPIKDSWENYSNKKSGLQEGLERCVQTTISKEYDWEVCATPMGADSVFITPKAIIHIDAKCMLNSDTDAKENMISIGKNQTSYASENALMHSNKRFISNLPTIYKHDLFGDLVCLTYFLKIKYDKNYSKEFWNNFDIQLCCVPNGILRTKYNDNFFIMGKNRNVELDKYISKELYDMVLCKCNDEQKYLMEKNYIFFEKAFYVKDEVFINKDKKDLLQNLYVEKYKGERSRNSKRVNNKKWNINDYIILDQEKIDFISNNYSTEDKYDILNYYEELTDVYIIDLSLRAEDKTSLKNKVYKVLNINTICDSLRVQFNILRTIGTEPYNWDRCRSIELY